ncbi:MAG: alpha/beta hydrolase [Trueperaceae bacterium]
MENTLHLPGIKPQRISTPRLSMYVLTSGPADGTPVLFVHGNASSSTFWEETMLALPDEFRAIAPDLRGYGDTDDEIVDATRGVQDWVDDLLALKETLGITKYHVAGHSLGGAVLWGLIPADAENILSATFVAPGSPYGFGGTKDVDGTPTYGDFAGSGGGLVNPEMVKRMTAGDRSSDDPSSPRNVMNALYWKPPFRAAREEALLSSMLSEKMGADRYPGDSVPSSNWPGVGPGVKGPINAISPKYVGDTVTRFLAAAPKPPILWVWGADDQIVSDTSLSEIGYLGKIGAVPGWPGDEVHPPQPMISQTRAVLEKYAAAGGQFREVRFEDTAHTPYIEHPEKFMEEFSKHLSANTK